MPASVASVTSCPLEKGSFGSKRASWSVILSFSNWFFIYCVITCSWWQYQHNILYTKILVFLYAYFILPYFWKIIRELFPFKYPIKLKTDSFGGIDRSRWIWSGHTSPSIMSTPFQVQRVFIISHISSLFLL